MKEVDLWTDELKNLSDLMLGVESGFREFDLEHGTAMGWNLYTTKTIQVARALFSQGAVLPLHDHKFSVETLILYQGAMELALEGEDGVPEIIQLKIGESYTVDKAKRHKLFALEESRMVAVLIPPDEDLAT